CPDWEVPHGSSRPIPIKKLLSVLGYDDVQAVAIVERLEEQAYINRAFGYETVCLNRGNAGKENAYSSLPVQIANNTYLPS
ncbi:hypothetical protein ACTHSH_10935, partial [Neisseria sp. P0003.S004]